MTRKKTGPTMIRSIVGPKRNINKDHHNNSNINLVPCGRSMMLWNPETFYPTNYLRSLDLAPHSDAARYFVHKVLIGMIRSGDHSAVLHAKYLKRIMGRCYKKVVDSLLAGGVVARKPYKNGHNSFRYRLTNRFLADRPIGRLPTDSALKSRLSRLHDEVKQDRQQIWLPVHYELLKKLSSLSIDGEAAREALYKIAIDGDWNKEFNESPILMQETLISRIEQRDIGISVSRYGRIFNPITSIKRELRRFLRIDGEQAVSLDISNAQPAILAITHQRHTTQHEDRNNNGNTTHKHTTNGNTHTTYDSHTIPPARGDLIDMADVRLFADLTGRGNFYEDLGRIAGLTRQAVKDRFIVDVLAKKGRYPSVVEDVFRRTFPTVYCYIQEVNATDHGNLIRMLQFEESRLVIEQVGGKLVQHFPSLNFVTLHDSIYAAASKIHIVEQVFQEVFVANGFTMKLKRGE